MTLLETTRCSASHAQDLDTAILECCRLTGGAARAIRGLVQKPPASRDTSLRGDVFGVGPRAIGRPGGFSSSRTVARITGQHRTRASKLAAALLIVASSFDQFPALLTTQGCRRFPLKSSGCCT
eukprot:10367789-Alexandrium_andersonii.AAC.1